LPLTRIEIEQTGRDQWHAEIEIGGLSTRRTVVNLPTLEAIIEVVCKAWTERPSPPVRPPVGAAPEPVAAKVAAPSPPRIPPEAPQTPRKPISKLQAARMRLAADEAAAAAHPGLGERQEALRSRRALPAL
jgi:hypothetical protein